MWTVKGDTEFAEKSYRKAIELNPTQSEIHYGLAALLDEKGDFDEAQKEYLAALEHDPVNSRERRHPEGRQGALPKIGNLTLPPLLSFGEKEALEACLEGGRRRVGVRGERRHFLARLCVCVCVYST